MWSSHLTPNTLSKSESGGFYTYSVILINCIYAMVWPLCYCMIRKYAISTIITYDDPSMIYIGVTVTLQSSVYQVN